MHATMNFQLVVRGRKNVSADYQMVFSSRNTTWIQDMLMHYRYSPLLFYTTRLSLKLASSVIQMFKLPKRQAFCHTEIRKDQIDFEGSMTETLSIKEIIWSQSVQPFFLFSSLHSVTSTQFKSPAYIAFPLYTVK